MRKLLLLGSLVALLVPAASHAQVQLGVRVGYAWAMGDAYQLKGSPDVSKMKDGMKSQVPIQLDVNYKLDKDFALGVYGSYGFGQLGGTVKDLCDGSGLDCSASDIRAGAQAIYGFNQLGTPFAPWAALNVGYERGKLSISGPASGDQTASGYEVGLTIGGDFKVADKLTVGPFVGYSLAQYTSVKNSGDAALAFGGTSLDIDKKWHEWLQIGVIGKFDL